jgi:uncharacterized membrane protein YoaK (UPF0700 family)
MNDRMNDRRMQLFAATLSGVAGYVDAVGWLTSGGLFVSFMSGNVTKLGLSIAGRLDSVALGAGLIGCFVGGVVLGSLTGRAVGRQRQPVAVLLLVSGLMILATVGLEMGVMVPSVLALAAAMGAKNTIFAADGEVKVGLTYMTGALVRVGKRITTALTGGERWGWVAPLLLFSGMVTGAALGATAQLALGHKAMWLATAAMLLLTVVAGRLQRGASRGE